MNEDQEFRAKFLQEPIAVMENEGLFFSEEAKNEISVIHEELRENIEGLLKIPSGYEPLIDGLKKREPIEKIDLRPTFIN